MACTSPIDCDTKDISPEDAFKKLIAKDGNGCPALRVVEVSAAGEDSCDLYVTCDNKDEDWRTLFFKMITTDTNDCWAVRVVKTS